MKIQGCLDMRVGNDIQVCGVEENGTRVFEILPLLVDLLNTGREPTLNQYTEWFRRSVETLLPTEKKIWIPLDIAQAPYQIVIDTNRKIILSSSTERAYLSPRDINTLSWNHSYQFFRFYPYHNKV